MTDAAKNSVIASAERNRRGFTLIELIVVITIIVLAASIALPTAINLFSAGADSQAYNIIAAQLARARAIAIRDNTYAGLHIQKSDNPDMELDAFYSAVVTYNSSAANFDLADGTKPRKLPGSIAFGQLNDSGSTAFVSGGTYQTNVSSNMDNFTTFTIVFGPSGQVVTNVAGGGVTFADNNLFIATASGPPGSGATELWTNPGSEAGVTAITMFDYTELVGRSTDATRRDYLNEAGQFLPINVYTGQLFPRE